MIVDEVLARGRCRVQRKCLGKMKDVAASGHCPFRKSQRMISVRSLCSRVIWFGEWSIAHGWALRKRSCDPYLHTYTASTPE